MKILKKIASLFMFAAAALTISCSEEIAEDNFVIPVDESRTISFSVTLPETRGEGTVSSEFDEFDIYATYSDYDAVTETSMSTNEDGIWTLDTPMGMPQNGSITFYAVSSLGGDITFDETTTSVSYTMPTDVEAQPTVLMSAPFTLDNDATSLNVELTFDYVLAAVGFVAGDGDYDLTKIEISNFYPDATIAFSDSYSTDSYTLGDKTTATYASASLEDGSNNFFMIPAQSMEGATYKAYFSYYKDGAEVDSYIKENALVANSDLEVLGMEFTYTIDSKSYVAPDYITPDESYGDPNDDGAYELGDILVGDEVTAVVETNSTLTWASSNENVATVDSNGVVTGIGGGTATITATSKTDGVVISFEVTVWIPIDGANISIPTDQTNTLDVAATLELYATAVYEGAYSIYHEPFTVTDWSSSDITVATVATTAVTTGTVTGVAAGDATITLTIKGNLSGNERSTTRTVTVEAGSFYNYGDLSIGQYVKSDGSISDSSSGAVAVIYYVASDYALAASLTISSTSTTQWCPSSYTSSYIGATSTTDGYSNSAKMYAQSSTSSYATNPVSYAKYKGTISGAYDGKGKGEFYLPSRCEAYLFISKLFSGTSITMSETSYATTFSGTKSSIYNNNSSVYGSIAYIVTSTETSSTQCNIVAGDGSGATTSKLKDSYKNLSTSTWAPTVKILPIVKL